MLYILRLFLPLRYRRSSLTAVALAVGFFMASVVVFERFGRCNHFGILYIYIITPLHNTT